MLIAAEKQDDKINYTLRYSKSKSFLYVPFYKNPEWKFKQF